MFRVQSGNFETRTSFEEISKKRKKYDMNDACEMRIKFLKHLWFINRIILFIFLQFAIIVLFYDIRYREIDEPSMVRCHIESDTIHARIYVQELQGTPISVESWISLTLSHRSDNYTLDNQPISLSRLNSLIVYPESIDSEYSITGSGGDHFVKMELCTIVGEIKTLQIVYAHDTTNCFAQHSNFYHSYDNHKSSRDYENERRETLTRKYANEQYQEEEEQEEEEEELLALWLEPQTYWNYYQIVTLVLLSLADILWIFTSVMKKFCTPKTTADILGIGEDSKKTILVWNSNIKKISERERDTLSNGWCCGKRYGRLTKCFANTSGFVDSGTLTVENP